jgi:hypothetical protein
MSIDQDGTKQIKGVSQERREGKPLQLGRRVVAGSTSKVVPPHKTPDGQHVEGTTSDQSNTSARDQHYAHPDQAAHRRSLGATPHPDSKRR